MKKYKYLIVIVLVVILLSSNKTYAESHVHEWGSGKIKVKSSCTSEGIIVYTCSFCGETKEETIPELGHKMVYTEELTPTCADDGHIGFYTCERCLDIFSDNEGLNELSKNELILKSSGHNFIEIEGIEPTCKKAGMSSYKKCETCGAIYVTIVHTYFPDPGDKVQVNNLNLYGSPWATSSTNKVSGTYYIYKSGVTNGRIRITDQKEFVGVAGMMTGWIDVSGFLETVSEDKQSSLPELVIKPLDHDWGAWEPSRLDSKREIRWCNNEGSKHSEERRAIDSSHVHTFSHFDYKASTCSEYGNIEYYYCSSCRRYYKDSGATNEINSDDTIIPLRTHTWLYAETTTYPTCRTRGIDTYVCSGCGETKTKYTPKARHRTQEIGYKDSTCSEAGNIYYCECSRCGKKYDNIYADNELFAFDCIIPAKEHSIVFVDKLEPTCEEEGYIQHYKCRNCEELFVDECGITKISDDDVVIPAKSHDWDDGTVVQDADCTSRGSVVYTCKNDSSHQMWDTIPIKGHLCVKINAKDASCSEDGNIEYWICSRCGKYYNNSEGTVEFSEEDIIINKYHLWDEGTITNPPTENETGIRTYTCIRCGEKKREEIAALGHDYKELVGTLIEATCTEDGKEADMKCTRCGNIITGAIIKAKGHIEEEIPAVEATCLENGSTAGKKCSICKKVLVKTEEVAKLGHYYVDIVNSAVAPTCTEYGKGSDKKCTRCNSVISGEVINPTGHNLIEYSKKNSSCIEKGNNAYWACSKCKKYYSDEKGNNEVEKNSWIIPELGHDYKDITGTFKEATCSDYGKEADKKCSRCEKIQYGNRINKKGHIEEVIPAVEATYMSVGRTEGKKCSICGDVLVAPREIPKLSKDNSGTSSSSNTSGNKVDGEGSGNKNANERQYSNEWVDGKWYDEQGNQTYQGVLLWKCNSTGWWVEDSSGWYPVSNWQKIDGVWYYFGASGYMATNEYVDGYWLNNDGSCSNDYYLTWKSNSIGWWIEDKSGWWPSSRWLKINGSWYYFNSSGYMVTNQYVDGYWIGSDGVCN